MVLFLDIIDSKDFLAAARSVLSLSLSLVLSSSAVACGGRCNGGGR